jgi:hypothetical protein
MDSISIESFVKTSEVDQELVYEMYQAEIQGNDWVCYGLAPMMTTQLFDLVIRNGKFRETYTQEGRRC